MDKGNHYQKCDLQIHTPRDKNWKGGACVSDEDREKYSKKFIRECREAGLTAVAITDHHDMVFYTYINKESKAELDQSGNPIPSEKQIIVFPGIEVTLSQPPIQGLLIFDADFPENLFDTVLGALSIAQAQKEDSKTSEVQPIPSNSIGSINEIYEKLDGTDRVKGRYIFFPHISEKGHKTLMRQGFNEVYAKMSSVGGYVSGNFKSKGEGYKKIINGEVEAYGFKSVAAIQTSDYRANSTLKQHNIATWIKWREPTAEALRQACLAKESRISLVEPEMPNIYIEKVDVTNSTFLSKFDLDLNPQLNSIIGGRGSGKSTILEYLRWVLCDQTELFDSDDDKSEIEKRRNSLIEKTLKKVKGEVRIFFMVNGTRHIVKRNSTAEDVLLKIGSEEFQSVRPQQIKDLLPIQAYSQKQLSSISMRPDELKRFIEQTISEEIEDMEGKIANALTKVKTSYESLSKNKSLKSELKKNEVEISSLKKQIERLRSDLKGISDEDKKIIDCAKYYENENNRFEEVELEYSSVLSNIQSFKNAVEKHKSKEPNNDLAYENKSIIHKLNSEREDYLKGIFEKLDSISEDHSISKRKVDCIRNKWKLIKDEFEEKYKEVKEKSSSSQTTLKIIKEIEEKIENLELIARKKRLQISEIEISDGDFEKIYEAFMGLQSEKIEKLKSSTKLFTKLSDGLIKADFARAIDIDKLGEEINKIFSSFSLNIKKEKGENLAELISNSDKPVRKWSEVVYELKSLSEFTILIDSKDKFPPTPILDSVDFSTKNKRKISESLSSEGLLTLATIRLEFLPNFYYLTHNEMGDKIPFEEASAGQQATALLNILLNKEGFPLVIDQPEDDIDNRAIEKIIKNIWNSKKKRQIIISSHNANIVVNGDSELVICCDYNETSEQTKGHIKYEGSIDKEEIRNEITSIMEGGERAFKLRKEKYGF